MKSDLEKREEERARVLELAREAEQSLRFLSEANSLARRMDCWDDDDRYGNCKEYVFRVVDALSELARFTLERIPKEQPSDLPC